MLVPKKKQFQKWSVPSKWSYISGILGVIAFIMAIYFQYCSRSKSEEYIEQWSDVVNVSRILEGSPLCCEIKTAEVIILLPEEGEIKLDASIFIGLIPKSTDPSELSFSYSINIKDSSRVFNCQSLGKSDLNIYFFKLNNIFCAKPAIMDLRDPDDNCSILSLYSKKKDTNWLIRFLRRISG